MYWILLLGLSLSCQMKLSLFKAATVDYIYNYIVTFQIQPLSLVIFKLKHCFIKFKYIPNMNLKSIK